MEPYRIGKFTFDTYEDYVRGQADVRNIRKLTNSVDIYRPEVALRLYQSIRSGRIRIYSEIGERFLLDLADIVAENAKKESCKAEETAKRRRKSDRIAEARQQKRQGADTMRKIFGIVCVLAAIACFIWYFWSDFTNSRGNEVNDYLKSLREDSQGIEKTVETLSNNAFFSEDSPELAAALSGESEEDAETKEWNILPEYEAVLAENSDFAGWITIEGTKVDYPVMLTKADADYYLKRNFNGQSDINGTLFMDARTELTPRSTNIIVYGHNMKSGEMFGSLKKYLDEEYWMEHRKILFDTIYEKGTYEIFAVCLAQVQYQNAEGFRYYDFIWADSEDEFNEFLDNIEQLSVFTAAETPVYGDELLTLSTCNSYVEDGRLFLVAKKCTDAE